MKNLLLVVSLMLFSGVQSVFGQAILTTGYSRGSDFSGPLCTSTSSDRCLLVQGSPQGELLPPGLYYLTDGPHDQVSDYLPDATFTFSRSEYSVTLATTFTQVDRPKLPTSRFKQAGSKKALFSMAANTPAFAANTEMAASHPAVKVTFQLFALPSLNYHAQRVQQLVVPAPSSAQTRSMEYQGTGPHSCGSQVHFAPIDHVPVEPSSVLSRVPSDPLKDLTIEAALLLSNAWKRTRA